MLPTKGKILKLPWSTTEKPLNLIPRMLAFSPTRQVSELMKQFRVGNKVILFAGYVCFQRGPFGNDILLN